MTTICGCSGRDVICGATILLVDDDEDFRKLVARLLARARAMVIEATSGRHAIELAAAHRIDLLLTDVEMPGTDGGEVARAVRRLRPQIAVVFMSGTPRAAHVARGRLETHDAFIDKPFEIERLVSALAAVRDLTRSQARAHAE